MNGPLTLWVDCKLNGQLLAELLGGFKLEEGIEDRDTLLSIGVAWC